MMKRGPVWILAAALTVIGLLAVGIASYIVWIFTLDLQGTFHNTTDLADLDGDGDMDVVVQNVRNESEFTAFAVTTLWFNEGDGKFTPHRLDEYRLDSGWDSTTADVDRDGDADLLVFQGTGVRVYLNQGGAQNGTMGAFASGGSIHMPPNDGQYGSLLIGDLNNDSYLDGIMVGCCGRLFTIDTKISKPNFSWQWMKASTGQDRLDFEQSPLQALDGLAIPGAALGDLDGDGDLDLFAAVIASPEAPDRDRADRVMFNDGLGTFTDSGQRLGDIDSTSVALGDMDGDGDLDALLGNKAGASLWINQGGAQNAQQGMFTRSSNDVSGADTTAVFLADLDGDDDLDALIGGPKQAVIWWNDGQANLSRSDQRFRFNNRHALAVADFNADGRGDIFAAEYSRHFRVWYNQGDGTFRTRP